MKYSNICWGLCIALILLVFKAPFSSRAAAEIPSCSEYLVMEVAPLTVEFETLLNEFFLNSVPSSDQVDTAMEMLRAYKQELQKKYAEGLLLEGAISINARSDEFLSCTFYRDQYLSYSEALLQTQTLGSSTSKRTFAVVDALKSMNEELRAFSDIFYETFPGMFQKMDSALPCYTKECIQ